MSRYKAKLLLVFSLIALLFLSLACKKSEEAKRKRAELDSLQRDTAHRFVNPLRSKPNIEAVEGWRESIGNVDSLVTPQQPTIPNH